MRGEKLFCSLYARCFVCGITYDTAAICASDSCRKNLTILGVWIAGIRVAPYVLQALQ